MHIKKYDFNYSRRYFMDKMAKGTMGAAGDPFLGAQSDNWNGDQKDWGPPSHGGPKGQVFWDTSFEFFLKC